MAWRHTSLITVAAIAVSLSALSQVAERNAANVAIARAKMVGGAGAGFDVIVNQQCRDHRWVCRNGAVYLLDRRPADAVQLARYAVAACSSDRLASYWLGEALWRAGKKHEARRVWRQSGVLRPKLSALLFDAWGAAGRGDVPGAERLVNKALDLDPQFAGGYRALASLRWGRDWPGTVAALEQALRWAERGSAEYYWTEGRLHLIRGDWVEAVDALQKSERLGPSPWTGQFLAEARRRAGAAAAREGAVQGSRR